MNHITPTHMGLSENVVYPIVPNGFADHYPYDKWLFHWEYTQFSDIPTLNITIFDGKTHYKWPFSIAMLVYQRVNIIKPLSFHRKSFLSSFLSTLQLHDFSSCPHVEDRGARPPIFRRRFDNREVSTWAATGTRNNHIWLMIKRFIWWLIWYITMIYNNNDI